MMNRKAEIDMQIKKKQYDWLAWFGLGIATLFWVYWIWINPFVMSDSGWWCRKGLGGILFSLFNMSGALGGLYHLVEKTEMNSLLCLLVVVLVLLFLPCSIAVWMVG